jgi:hypothetical protein
MGVKSRTPSRKYQDNDYLKYKNAADRSNPKGKIPTPSYSRRSRLEDVQNLSSRSRTVDPMDYGLNRPHQRISVEKIIERAKNREKEASLLKIKRRHRERRLRELNQNSVLSERQSLGPEVSVQTYSSKGK